MTVLTLRKRIDGKRGTYLNGKILSAKMDPLTNQVMFYDMETGNPMWQTSPVIHKELTEDGLILKTDNYTYDFINLKYLIPTRESDNCIGVTDTEDNSDDEDRKFSDTSIPELKIVSHKKEYKQIHYGDGYDRYSFEFNRDITKEEFIEFLKSRHYQFRDANEFPYCDYSKIEGSGKCWTYTWVRVYTD